MTQPRIAIIGLGLIGASIGSALQRAPSDFEVVGHDKDPSQANAAKKQKCVQRTEWNLHRACMKASLIVTAIPVSELPTLYEQISEDLEPGTLVLSITDVMQPAVKAARNAFPAHAHFVAGHPILIGLGSVPTPRPDLFDDVQFCLAADADTEPEAFELASNLVTRIGATPLFMDAQEHDGMIAMVEQLPQLLGAVLMQVSRTSRSWRDAKKLAGRRFAQSTELGHSAENLSSALYANRENLLYRLHEVEEELGRWRQMLESDDEEALNEVLETVVESRFQWEGQAELKNWDEVSVTTSTEANPGLLRQMFFGNLFSSRRPSPEDLEED